MSLRALHRMYLPDEQAFVFCIRRGPGGDMPEGISSRYTAIVLIGLATQPATSAEAIFGGRGDTHAVCNRLLQDIHRVSNMGDVALTLWAAAVLGHPDAGRALDRLRRLDPIDGPHPTVEVAWALSALTANHDQVGDTALADRVARRLKVSFNAASGVFPHWPYGVKRPFLRSHVSCFADLVYPVQALSHHYRATGDEKSIEAARRCGRLMCDTQGEQGQWWWHFDARTGRVIEGYPVYAVHQDAMAPMALWALRDACGEDSTEAIERGVGWLVSSRELRGETLIDEGANLIWRKVARHEPGKLSRGLQALASRVSPGWRAPVIGSVLRPGRIDHECRPYHLGWLLHAWPPEQSAREAGQTDAARGEDVHKRKQGAHGTKTGRKVAR